MADLLTDVNAGAYAGIDPDPGMSRGYLIQPGDTLSKLAQTNNTDVASLLKLNPQITDPNKIYAGQSLNLAAPTPTTIAADGLSTTQTPVQLPTAPVVSPVTINTVTPTPTPPTTTIPDYLKTYLDQPAPANPLDTYNQLNTSLGVDEKTQKVNDLQAQLDQITAGQQVDELKLPGEGINAAGASARNITLERNNAIQAIPIQAQLLVAQGNLNAATAKLNQVFKIQSDYATQLFNYNQDKIKAVYDFATKEEQIKLDALKTQQTQDFTTQQNNLNNAQALSVAAMNNGQADIAAQITKLDPKSATFAADLAKLQSQIKAKVDWSAPYIDPATGNQVQKNNTTGEIRTLNNPTGNKTPTTGGASGGSGSGGSGNFTSTQSNKGAASAGVSIEEFNGYTADDKNFFINSATAKKKVITDAQKSGENLTDLTAEINSSNLSQLVKDNLVKYAQGLYPQAKPSSGFNWWNPLTWGAGIYNATHQ